MSIRRIVLSIAVALSAAGCGNGAGAPPPFVKQTIEFTTGDWTVPSATEDTKCIYTKLPGDTDFLVGAYRAHLLPHSHHFNMFYVEPTNPLVTGKPLDTLTTCDYGFKTYLAGSQWADVDETIPENLGLTIPAGSILILEAHFVNATDGDIPARVDVAFDSADPAKVTDEIGLYFNVMDNIKIDGGAHERLSARCPADPDVNLVFLTSHMHHFGESFEINLIDDASGASTPLYLNTDYSHPKAQKMWDTPVVVKAGQSLEWACNYRNPDATPVIGGGSAETNEMCIMAAFYWPKHNAQPYCFSDPTVTQLP